MGNPDFLKGATTGEVKKINPVRAARHIGMKSSPPSTNESRRARTLSISVVIESFKIKELIDLSCGIDK